MFSCSHFSNFLSDPIGKQSAMSKRVKVHRWRSQNQWFQRRRDQTTRLHGARGKNPPGDRKMLKVQILGNSVIRRNLQNSTSTRRLVRAATPRREFQNMRYTNHQYMTKIFQHLQRKLGITEGYSTFSMEALKTNALIWECSCLRQ